MFCLNFLLLKKTLPSRFLDGAQLSQGYKATVRISWYSFSQLRKDERLSRPWSYPELLNLGPLD